MGQRYRLTKRGKAVVAFGSIFITAAVVWVALLVFEWESAQPLLAEDTSPDIYLSVEEVVYPSEYFEIETEIEEEKPAIQVLRMNSQAPKKAALTFDDGPCPYWTEEYLKVLVSTPVSNSPISPARNSPPWHKIV